MAVWRFLLWVQTTPSGTSGRRPRGAWSGWAPLPGDDVRASPAAVAVGKNADGRLEVFAVSIDNALLHNWQTTPGAWSGWASLPGDRRSGQPSRSGGGEECRWSSGGLCCGYRQSSFTTGRRHPEPGAGGLHWVHQVANI